MYVTESQEDEAQKNDEVGCSMEHTVQCKIRFAWRPSHTTSVVASREFALFRRPSGPSLTGICPNHRMQLHHLIHCGS